MASPIFLNQSEQGVVKNDLDHKLELSLRRCLFTLPQEQIRDSNQFSREFAKNSQFRCQNLMSLQIVQSNNFIHLKKKFYNIKFPS